MVGDEGSAVCEGGAAAASGPGDTSVGGDGLSGGADAAAQQHCHLSCTAEESPTFGAACSCNRRKQLATHSLQAMVC